MQPNIFAESAPKRRIHKRSSVDIFKLPDEALAAPSQVLAILQCCEPTLRRWRREGRGPKWVLIEGRPRYPVGALRQFIRGE